MKTRPTVLLRSASYTGRKLEPTVAGEDPVHNRQEIVPGYHQDRLRAAAVVLIGAGGLAGEIGEGLARKGIGALRIFDPDRVELSNLNRQRFFEEDLYQYKAPALAKNLAREATDSTVFAGYAFSFEQALERGLDLESDVVVCGVDNDQARLRVAAHYLGRRSVVVVGVDEFGEHGYVFVQEPGGPCFACLFPQALDDDGTGQCARAGAVKDILKVVAGIALYAIDSLLMDRRRAWNFKHVRLAGFMPDTTTTIETRDDCPLCVPGCRGVLAEQVRSED